MCIRDSDLAQDIRAGMEKKRYSCERSREWAQVPAEHKMTLLMVAGIDGDLGSLARKAWQEFTPPERVAVQVAIRWLRDTLAKCPALSVRAG